MSSKDLQQTPTQPNPVANTSPITKITAAQVTDDLGFASPVGGAIKVVASPPRRLPALPPWWWDPNGPPNQAPPKEIPEHEAETPPNPKTVLPAGYDATTGTTPLGHGRNGFGDPQPPHERGPPQCPGPQEAHSLLPGHAHARLTGLSRGNFRAAVEGRHD